MSERKRFDRELFEKYDKAAREATKKYFERISNGVSYDSEGNVHDCGVTFKVEEHPDRYAQDLIVTRNDFYNDGHWDQSKFNVECEVKRVWKEEKFPYDSVQLPQRKEKFCDGNTVFFIWNEPMTHAAVFEDEVIKDLTPIEVPNKYMYKDEYFFQIPLDKVDFISVDS